MNKSKANSEGIPLFFLVTDKYSIGTSRGIGSSNRTVDIHFHDLAKNYELQEKLNLASAYFLRPAWNPPLAYPMQGEALISSAACYLAAFGSTEQEKSEGRKYLINNGLIRILATDPKLLSEVKKLAQKK